jgi:RHS repeat-associated protein
VDQKAQSGALKLGFEPNRRALRLRPAKSGNSGKPLASRALHHRNPKPKTMGVTYYGYRYHDPNTGRWPSRDPIREDGGMNLYAFAGNDGVNRWDYMGLAKGVFRVAMKGFGGVDPDDYDANSMDIFTKSFSANIYDSRDENSALSSIIKNYDLNNDGKLTEKEDCPPWRVKLVGYSWGAVSALNVANDLGGKVENPSSNLFVAVGTLDPVTTGGHSIPAKPAWVVSIYNIYQTNGMWRGGIFGISIGSFGSGAFKGNSVAGATNIDKSSYTYKIGSRYYHAKKPWEDHISVQRYASDVVSSVNKVVLKGEK